MKRTLIVLACALLGAGAFARTATAEAAEKPIQVGVYYFGNYHLDPRNEKRLGKGWTEWKLVRESKPRFHGHDQPKIPLWGETDEADPKDMARKIDAAADHGIDAFIFDWYHYNDGPFLQRTIDDGFLRAPNRKRLKFALMWANHDWVELFPATKDGGRPLIYPGAVTPETFDRICDHVIRDYFSQPNYWLVDGKPYFSVYELTKFGESFGSFEKTKEAIARFRAKAKAAGFPDIHLNAVYWGRPNIPGEGTVEDPVRLIESLGFDSVTSYVWVHHVGLPKRETDFNWVRDRYMEHWDAAAKAFSIPYYPNVSMGWDASPRTAQDGPWDPSYGYPYSNLIVNNTPENFRQALQMTRDRLLADPKAPRIVTVNSWNEWTEGSYIEPDAKRGYAYLEAVRDVFGAKRAEAVRPAEPRPFAVDGVFTDHMVLQRRQPVRISGTAQAGVIVSVTLAGANVRVQTDAAGRWTAELPAMEAGGPYEVVVQALVDAQNGAFSEIRLEDVMIGEVWVASGQSNMEFWVLGRNLEGPRHYHLPDGEEAAALKDPDLRIFYMPHGLSVDGPVSQPPSGARWRRAETRAANGRCSAVAYWFAKELRASLGDVPVGIVSASWGGSCIQPWIPLSAFASAGDTATVGRIAAVTRPAYDVGAPRVLDAQGLRESLRARMAAWLEKFRASAPEATAEAYRSWAKPGIDLSGWKRAPRERMTGLHQPGAVWYRFEVDVPESWRGAARIRLDYVNDVDETFLDGVKVGETTIATPHYWETPRCYPVADLAPGRHVVAIRAEDHYSTGAIGPGLFIENDATGATLPLGTGEWCERVEFRADIAKIGERPQDSTGTLVEPRYHYQTPTTLYNAMIAPLTAMNVGGAIWYQGCSNSGDPEGYIALQRRLIDAWRAAFRNPGMPFVLTQLSAFQAHRPDNRLEDDFWKSQADPQSCIGFGLFRLAQDECRRFPNTGIACTIDIGDHSDIHPANKKEVGRRLAHEALRIAYGDATRLPGPRAESVSVSADGRSLVVRFRDTGAGLALDGGATAFHPHLFAVAGVDGRYRWAEGELLADGSVRVSAKDVPDPVSVRYCVSAYPPGVGFRRRDDGLPVYPFELSVKAPAADAGAAGPVVDLFEPLEPGAVQLGGSLGAAFDLSYRNWALGDIPYHDFAEFFRTGRPQFATGEMWGKYVRSLAMFYRARPSAELKARIEDAVKDILSAQRPDGSISCDAPEKRPVPKGGDLWERKYVMLALDRYADFVADDPAPAVESLKRQADAILREIGPGEGQTDIRKLGWSLNHIESATLLEPMMRLYNRTHDGRYLDFAKYIVATGGTDGRWDIFRQARDWTIPRDIGGVYPKAYEMLSVFEGACEYWRATGDPGIGASVRNLFTMILEREMTLVGNGGGDQPFHPDVYGEAWDDTAFEQTNPAIRRMMETCTGVTWLKFNAQVFRLTGDPRAMDAIEKYAYNGLLGAMKPEGDGFSYVNLLNGAKTTNQGWGWTFGDKRVTCCNLNGPMGLAYLPYVAVMRGKGSLAVNLYGPMRVATSVDGRRVSFVQTGDCTDAGRIMLTFGDMPEPVLFALRLRIPAWSGRTEVSVNGARAPSARAGSYLALDRVWRAGDRVEIAFDMRARLVPAPHGSDRAGDAFAAVTRGPLVLARDEREDPAFSAPVRVAADAQGFVAAERVPRADGRLAFRVPTSGGGITMFDYASVDCWRGTRICTWLPVGP